MRVVLDLLVGGLLIMKSTDENSMPTRDVRVRFHQSHSTLAVNGAPITEVSTTNAHVQWPAAELGRAISVALNVTSIVMLIMAISNVAASSSSSHSTICGCWL